MQIRKIEILNYRKLIEPISIDKIGDGITVIAGDNEEGKSTLLQALRSALFDRHNLTGDAADSMQPFGCKVRPEITLEFEIDGFTYKLTKGFCQRPTAELITPTGIASGAHAEERLQELLRFNPPGRGKAKPSENHGVFGMFWIEQGRAFSPLPLSDDNRTTMMNALEGEIGQVLGGARGRKLRDAIAAQYLAVFTNGGKPRGKYAESISSVNKLEEEVAPKREQLRSYDSKVDELQRVQERLSAHEKEGRLAKATTALTEAQAKLARIAVLETNVTNALRDRQLAEAEVRAPTNAVTQRDALVTRDKKNREDAGKSTEAFRAAEESISKLSEELTKRSKALRDAEAASEDANAGLLAIDQRLEWQRLVGERDKLNAALTAAKEADKKVREARVASFAIKVDAAALKRLRSLDQKRIETESALAGSSTLIQFNLTAANRVTVDGQAVAVGDFSATDPTRIDIADVGAITIIPGGEELGTKKATADATRQQIQQALLKVGCASIIEAEAQEQDRREFDAVAAMHTEILKAHAPEGVDNLAERLATVKAAIGKLGDIDDGAAADRNAALTTQREADQRVKTARAEESSCLTALHSAKEQLASKRALKEAAHAKAIESANELKRAQNVKTDNILQEELAAASEDVTRAKAVHEQAGKLLTDADPEAAQLAFESARDGHKAIEEDIEKLDRRASDLVLELQIVGQQGLGEELQELEGRLDVAVQHRDRLARDADALQLLHETLNRAEQQAREAFLAPVQTRIQPYLRLLLPETELILSDDDLGVTALRRNGQVEPFESLSVGAREQVAVLTRLAFADLLRERGTIAPVVLDDALVNTDPNRFKRMVLAIRRAAKNLQVIVLTCNEAQWLQEGATTIRLADCIKSR